MNIIAVADRIDKLSQAYGTTAAAMLRDCKLSPKVVANMKSGSYPSIEKIDIIAKYFNLSIEQLLYVQPNDSDIFFRLSLPAERQKRGKNINGLKCADDYMDDYSRAKGVYSDISEEFKYKYLHLSESGKNTIDELLDFTYKRECSQNITASLEQSEKPTIKTFKAASSIDNHPPKVIETTIDLSKVEEDTTKF